VIGGSSSVSRTVTVKSTGTTDLDLTATRLTGPGASSFNIDPGFSGSQCVGALTPGNECGLEVRFDPRSGRPGTRQAQLVFDTNLAAPVTVPLSGSAVAKPPLRLKLRRAFASPGKTVRVEATVTNRGQVPLRKVNVSVSAPKRFASPQGRARIRSLAPGKSARVTVRLKVSRRAAAGSSFTARVRASAADAVAANASTRIRVR
jgi:uncharacterized membrane protein